MAQCLLVEDRPKVASLYILNLRVYVGLDVIWKKSFKEAIEVLDVYPNMDIVITRAKTSNNDKPISFYNAIKRISHPIPLIIIGTEKGPPKNTIVLKAGINIVELVQKAAKVLGVTSREIASKVIADYFQIPLRYLRYMKSCPCDIFLKIGKDENIESQYVKIINEDEYFDFPKDVLGKYMFKGAEKFYILSKLRIQFVRSFTKQLLGILEKGDLPFEERVQVNDLCYTFVSDEALNPDFLNEVYAVSGAAIQSVSTFSKSIAKTKPVEMIQQFLDQTTSYRYRMAQLTHILAYLAIGRMKWIHEDQEQKIAYVAFLHDILLKSDDLVQILDQDDYERENLNSEEEQLVQHHALWTMDFLGGFPSSDFDVNILIKQHHGTTEGVGFPKSYKNNISPIAVLFIVCEKYAREILKQGNKKFKHSDIAMNLLMVKEKATYRAVLDALKEVFR